MCVKVVGTCYGIACGCLECSMSRVVVELGYMWVSVGEQGQF